MEETVNKLAELQAEQANERAKANAASTLEDKAIAYAEDELTVLKHNRKMERLPYTNNIDDITEDIDNVKETIIDEWDGSKKTYKYGNKTLSFRQTGSLNIIDDVRLMELLIEKATIFDVVSKYIKGFKLTEVKKFVDVHNVQTGVASMEYKTSVTLKTE